MRVNWALHKTYVFGTHEPQVMQTIKDLVQPGWTAIDVGAHIGYSTLLLANCVGPKGRVIAFEPLTENFELLQENTRLNSYSNIFAENLALMGQSGQIELRSATPGAMTWVASTSVDRATAVETRIVEGITLDEYADPSHAEAMRAGAGMASQRADRGHHRLRRHNPGFGLRGRGLDSRVDPKGCRYHGVITICSGAL